MNSKNSLNSSPQLGTDQIAQVIKALTLEEKVSLLIGTGMDIPGAPPELQGPVVGFSNDRVPGAAGTTVAVPRLGIPSIVLADGPAGLRITPKRTSDENDTYYATAFPVATLLASSWDVGLIEQVGAAMGHEAKEYGVDILLSPALNIHRFPLGGRNFEYFSEDPLLSGKAAAAIVKGIQSRGVGTSIKHYVANNHEWNRNVINVIVKQRALREIYLKGFEIAVKEGNPWTVMTSYNKLNGTYTSEHSELLTDTLRNEWDYKGFVMTDWFGGRDPVAQISAGNNLLMPGTENQTNKLLSAVKEGSLDESVLDRNIEEILEIIMKAPSFKKYEYSNNPNLKENARIARDVASQGMILLSNKDCTLPLKRQSKISLFGNKAYELVSGGTGSGDVNKAYLVSMQEGLNEAGFTVHETLAKRYATYLAEEKLNLPPRQLFVPPEMIAERVVNIEDIHTAAADSDLALLTIGRNSGEFEDRKAENDFYLSDTEKSLIRDVAKVFHGQGKKVVVILNIGGVIETASWRDQVDAILLVWQPGQEAGHAIADIISGKVNPSGKLATTFSISLDDYPAAANFPGVVLEEMPPEKQSIVAMARAAEISYDDDIWVGYRAFSTKKIKTAYPFGYGLSYTKFTYSKLELSDIQFKESLSVSLDITNTGERPGREVVQLYISAPCSTLEKPAIELRGFIKTRELGVNESQNLCFEIYRTDLASFDEVSSMWLADAGIYTIKIGASSTDIHQKVEFQVPESYKIPL